MTTFFAAAGYDATEDRGRRRSPPTITQHEDKVANERKRRILSASTRDLYRNFAIAAWAIRKHLDYVSRFTFRATTPDEGYNSALEAFITEKMKRGQFETTGRHHFERAVRLTEAGRLVDGDAMWVKMGRGAGRFRGMVEMIEGDRCRSDRHLMPRNLAEPDKWINGVRIGSSNESLAFAFCDRTNGSQYSLRRIVPAGNVLHHAFFERVDQYRGVSPIVSGLNWFRDTYEGFEYALAKVKIGQLLGLAFSRDGQLNPFGPVTPTRDGDGDGEADSGYEIELPQGMFSVDLADGETAEILESKTPSGETVGFLKLMIHVALKSLDIPFSFFDESFTNFYGSRGGLIQYLHSCKEARSGLQQHQAYWADFRFGVGIADGELDLPSGKDFSFIKYEFVPRGVPWWDRTKEVRGAAMEVAAGFSSPQRICREIDTDFETNIRETAEAMKIADSYGVPLTFADSSAFRPAIQVNAEGEPDAGV